jgi:hypothetical protein
MSPFGTPGARSLRLRRLDNLTYLNIQLSDDPTTPCGNITSL